MEDKVFSILFEWEELLNTKERYNQQYFLFLRKEESIKYIDTLRIKHDIKISFVNESLKEIRNFFEESRIARKKIKAFIDSMGKKATETAVSMNFPISVDVFNR